MKLKLIYAKADNGVIGRDGKLPWHLPEDLAHFRKMTMGCVVIMGRKTWDSLVGPLSGRINIVISTRPLDPVLHSGVYRVCSTTEAIKLARKLSGDSQPAWVIGGGHIYAQLLQYADGVVVTEIHDFFEGDVYAPELGPEWHEQSRSDHTSKLRGASYSIVEYGRRKPAAKQTKLAHVRRIGKYIAWLALVQLVAWAPPVLLWLGAITEGIAVFLNTILTTGGAMAFVHLASRFPIKRFINPKE